VGKPSTVGSGTAGRASMEDAGTPPAILTLTDVIEAGCGGLPSDLPTSSYDLLRRSAERHGERTALASFRDVATHREVRRMSYGELFADVTRAANLFGMLGVGAQDVVAVLLPNLPETHIALWGAEAAGIVMPLNPMLEAEPLASLLAAAKARVLVTLGAGSDLFDKVGAILSRAPAIEHLVLMDEREGPPAPAVLPVPSRAGVAVHDYARALRAMPADHLVAGRDIAPGDTASYFCTGGTTGLPKIAVRTHAQVIANSWMAARMIGPALTEESLLFCGLPLFHVNAVMVTGLIPFLKGASVLLGTPQGFRAPGLLPRFWEIVEHHRVTGFSAVPTLLAALLEYPSEAFDLSSFRFAICGASPLSADLLQRFEKTCRVSISEGYGLTESACVASLNPIDGEHRPGSVGLPLPTEDIRIVILDAAGAFLRDCEVDDIGVVTIAGPNLFSGYLDDRHNAGAWVDRGDGRKWLNTGDLGRMDADGYLWLTGRAKDLIIRGGHNIDPSTIEEALYSHPDVVLAAAIGRPDGYAGEVPVAFVQLRSDAATDAPALLAHAAARIGERAAIPRSIAILPSMPLTAVGKIHKPSLRLIEVAAAAREVLDQAGIPFADICARDDPRRGTVVRISIDTPNGMAVRDALARFSFQIDIDCRAGN